MRVVFISNFLSAHQLPLCDTLYNLLDVDFKFISIEPISKERINLGWSRIEREYVIEINKKSVPNEIKSEIDTADVVIIGSAPDSLIVKRLKNKKLIFKYAERLYKGNLSKIKWIRAYIGTYLHYIRYKKYPFYILCASAYTSSDVSKFFSFPDRSFKWGYFPESKEYDINNIIDKKKGKSLLWVGRFLDWKHPEVPVIIAERLKKDGYSFNMNIVGTGVMGEEIKKLIREKGLENYINMTGAVPQAEVRTFMEDAQIFLFTSDFNEGWGAVLNEAMNSGCVCIASHAIGSAPYLIKDGENGYLYKNGDLDDLYKKVKKSLDNADECKAIGTNAYKTIIEEWNAKVAVQRFIKLSKTLISKQSEIDFTIGICSKAEILKNGWYYDE